MDTRIVYFDETGDDGTSTASSEFFVLTSLYMNAECWQKNFDIIQSLRKHLKDTYGFHVSEELHTKNLLSDKNPYRNYNWSLEQKREIIKLFVICLSRLDIKIINVIIDKTKFKDNNYHVLENALKYNIQRIENDSNGEWNYIIITDKGRLPPMRKTARAIRAYNPIQSKYSYDYSNKPIKNLIEDILEKDSKESYFIQLCDFVSYFVHLYYKTQIKKEPLPNRVGRVVDGDFICNVMNKLRIAEKLNLKASSKNNYGFVIYPQ